MRSLLSLLLWVSIVAASSNSSELSFGLINGGSAFFDAVRLGWEQRCKELGVNCSHEIGQDHPDFACSHRAGIVRQWIAEGVAGIALTPCKEDHGVMIDLFEEARQQGVPIVTFDSDIPNSTRAAYVGTDNMFLGRTMARLLRQLRPEGGTYAIIGVKAQREEGFHEEISKFNDRDDRAHWHHIPPESLAIDRYQIDYLHQMEKYASLNATAMITMIQSPMRDPNWTAFVESNRDKEITYVGTDGSDYQLEYLNRRYVDGLVGQLPFEWGTKSLEVLYDLVTKGNLAKSIFPTNLVSYNLIPLELPPPEVDQHLLGNLKYTGFVFFGVVVFCALACMVYSWIYRADIVVKAAQPFFLVMVATGVVIMSSSLVPLSFDDNGDPDSMTTTQSRAICMPIPWLLFTGFTVTFSALLSKTWRVNQIFRTKVRHARIQVSVKDAMLPFVVLLTANVIVLICWTVIDPLTYERVVDIGTDSWNREISSYGGCRCNTAVAYLIPLAAINLSAVGVACWQAYEAKGIKSEFSEAKYIGLTVFSLFQAFVMGIPVVAIVRNMPQAFYLVFSIMIFLLCMAILLLIFLPKMLMQRKYANMTESEQKIAIKKCVQLSSAGSERRSSGRSSEGISSLERRLSLPGNIAMNLDAEQSSDDPSLPEKRQLYLSGNIAMNPVLEQTSKDPSLPANIAMIPPVPEQSANDSYLSEGPRSEDTSASAPVPNTPSQRESPPPAEASTK